MHGGKSLHQLRRVLIVDVNLLQAQQERFSSYWIIIILSKVSQVINSNKTNKLIRSPTRPRLCIRGEWGEDLQSNNQREIITNCSNARPDHIFLQTTP